jgi:hypothetical protein
MGLVSARDVLEAEGVAGDHMKRPPICVDVSTSSWSTGPGWRYVARVGEEETRTRIVAMLRDRLDHTPPPGAN